MDKSISQSNEKKIYEDIGEIRGSLNAIHQHLLSVDRNLEIIRVSHEQNGKSIAEINERCRLRGKQMSDLFLKVGQVREDTQVMKIRESTEKEIIEEKVNVMDGKYKYIILGIIVIGIFALAALKVLEGKEALAAIVSVAIGAGLMALPNKSSTLKIISFIIFEAAMLMNIGCASWKSNASNSADNLKQCVSRCAMNCAVEAAQNLVCPIDPNRKNQ